MKVSSKCTNLLKKVSEKILLVGMFVCGICILVFHLRAKQLSGVDKSECDGIRHVWLSNGVGCTKMTINCRELQRKSWSIGNILEKYEDRINPSFVRHLDVTDCLSLEVTSALTQFDRMRQLTMSNVNLRSWNVTTSSIDRRDVDAVVAFRNLVFVNFTDVWYEEKDMLPDILQIGVMS